MGKTAGDKNPLIGGFGSMRKGDPNVTPDPFMAMVPRRCLSTIEGVGTAVEDWEYLAFLLPPARIVDRDEDRAVSFLTDELNKALSFSNGDATPIFTIEECFERGVTLQVLRRLSEPGNPLLVTEHIAFNVLSREWEQVIRHEDPVRGPEDFQKIMEGICGELRSFHDRFQSDEEIREEMFALADLNGKMQVLAALP